MAETLELLEPAPELEELRQQETSIVGEVSMSESETDRLKIYLDDELSRAEGDRGDFVLKLARWKYLYDAPMAEEPKNFPLANSANLTVPVIKETVNIQSAQLSQTTITPNPRWVVTTENDEWTPFIGVLERFLDRASREELDLDNVLETWILESCKYGTAVLEVGYIEEEVNLMVYDRKGENPKPVKTLKRGPRVWNVPLQDFIMPFDEQDPQVSPWVSKKIRMNGWTLRDRERDGKFSGVATVLGMDESTPLTSAENSTGYDLVVDEVTETQEVLEDTVPSLRRNYEINEVWIRFDANGDGIDEELLVYYHRQTRTLLSVRYHPYWHHERPFVALPYFPVEYRFLGQGLCEQLEAMQDEISAIHNQRLDNASVANVRAIKSRRTSGALKPGDPLFTGQIIEVEEMDDVEPFQLGEVYPSTIMNEQVSRDYVDRLAGTNDASRGSAMPVTRTTATAQLALLQESTKRYDQTVRKIRDGIKQVGRLTFHLYFQFGVDEKKPIQWLGERGKVIPAIFNLPYSAVDLGLGFEAGAPSSMVNKEAQKQNSIALFNLMVQMYGQILQLVGPIIGPQGIAPVASSMVSAAKDFMFTTLERFDVTNPDEILAGLTTLEKLLPNPEDLGGMEAFEGRVKELEALEQISRLEGLLTQGTGGDTRV